MGANDHAIVVGISKYPSLGDLDGPENDALDFTEWLHDPKGGNIPEANVHVVRSSRFTAPPAGAPHQARPQISEIIDLFDNFYAIGDANGSVGDRLYLYFAGHGFSKDIESAALLMANAARGAVAGRHFPGRPYANWFRQAAFFKEVVLFMDCCRETYSLTTIAGVPYDVRNGAHPGRKFFGFATKWSRAAREIAVGPAGVSRGIFTMALMSGLRGRAQADANGQIRGVELESYVFNYLRNTRQLEEDEEPEFDYVKTADILFNPSPGEAPCNPAPAMAPAPAMLGMPYVIRVKSSNGASFELVDGSLALLAPSAKSSTEWAWSVQKPGLYKVKRNDGTSRTIEVIGDQGVIDVQL